MRIALYQGKSLISLLIRWQTRSRYSHAAFLLDDGSVIEAWQPCVREITPFPNLNRTAPVLGRSNVNNSAASSSTDAQTSLQQDRGAAVWGNQGSSRSNVTNQAALSSSNAGTTSPSPIGWERAGVRAGAEKNTPHSVLRMPFAKANSFSLGNPLHQAWEVHPHLAALSRQHTPGTTVDIFKFIH